MGLLYFYLLHNMSTFAMTMTVIKVEICQKNLFWNYDTIVVL